MSPLTRWPLRLLRIDGDRRSRRPLESAVDVLRDLRCSVRSLAKAPGLAATVVLTLALGIGANTAIFSVVNGLLLDTVPFESPDELVFLSERQRQYPSMSVSYPTFLDWQERQRSFAAVAAHRYAEFNLAGRDEPQVLTVLQASATQILPSYSFQEVLRLYSPSPLLVFP